MVKNNKSQAAMEFLITYGWAILIVLVSIGVLAYFGVFNNERFLENSCNCGIRNYNCEVYFVHNSTDSYNIVKCCVSSKFSNITKACEPQYQYSYLETVQVLQ